MTVLTGGSVRYRFYSAMGLSMTDIARVVAFCTVSLWIGLATVLGTAFLGEPGLLAGVLGLPPVAIRSTGAVAIATVGGYLLYSSLRNGPVRIRKWEIPIPRPRVAGTQVLIGSLDWVLAATVFYVLLPGEHRSWV